MMVGMAESLPSPPASHSSQEPDVLAARLDELLEQYLELLDQYTTLREEVSKSFSAGFFSLAQAQRVSSLGAGRRYGEDCYDERMKAQRRVRYRPSKQTLTVSIEKRLEETPSQQAKSRSNVKTAEAESQQKQDIATSSNTSNHHEAQPTTDAQSEKSSSIETTKTSARKKQDPATRDPITWFGILAPPALRQTQRRFVTSIDDSMPALINVDLKMQELEEEIWSVRDELHTRGEYSGDDTDDALEEAESTSPAEPDPLDNSHKPEFGSKRRNLASRPAHAKSSLLKLGD